MSKAVFTDDPDIQSSWFYIDSGGNGDWYLTIVEIKEVFNKEGELERQPVRNTIRIATSGGKTPVEIKVAIAQLGRLMKDLGLNEYPDEAIKNVLSTKK